MKLKVSNVIGEKLPVELFITLKEGRITEIKESEYSEEELTPEAIKEVKKHKRKIKEFAADALIEKYKDPEVVKAILNRDFILMDESAMAISAALKMEQNVIFCGAGGYGKSEMVKALFSMDLLKNKVFIKSLNEATTEEDLFGGVRMKELMDTGAILYKTENSFINYEIVVFEEMFDADMAVLSALKDTLSSREVRNGVQREKIKTKIIIGLTNKSPEEVIENNSTEALVQRFPIIQRMEYPVTQEVINLMILRSMKDLNKIELEDILKREVLSATDQKELTPRKVMQIIKYIDSGIKITGGLTKIASVSTDKINATRDTAKKEEERLRKEFIKVMRSTIARARDVKSKAYQQLSDYGTYTERWR